MRIILASSSPRRRELLTQAGYQFDIIAPDEAVECGVCSEGGPVQMVAHLAVAKASSIVTSLLTCGDDRKADTLILAADTLAECQGHALGKPRDEDHAREILTLLSGCQHRVYTGLCLWPMPANAPQNEPGALGPRIAVEESVLQMESLSPADLDEYLATGLWRGKAGAFGYQDRPGWLRLVRGSASNVVGLPMEKLAEMLEQMRNEFSASLRQTR